MYDASHQPELRLEPTADLDQEQTQKQLETLEARLLKIKYDLAVAARRRKEQRDASHYQQP